MRQIISTMFKLLLVVSSTLLLAAIDNLPHIDFLKQLKVTHVIDSSNRHFALSLYGNKILIAGIDAKKHEIFIKRYLPSASPDRSFNKTGSLKIAIPEDVSPSFAIASQADGKVIMAVLLASKNNFFVARYCEDGQLDTSFNSSGPIPGIITFEAEDPQEHPQTGVMLDSLGCISVAQLSFQTGAMSNVHHFNNVGNLLPNLHAKENVVLDFVLAKYDHPITSARKLLFQENAPESISFSDLRKKRIPTGITPTTLPIGQINVGYSQQMTATGGTAPYTFGALNLPAGLTLSTSGLLSGTPTNAGSYSFVIDVADSTGNAIAVPYTLVICQPLTLTPQTLLDATVGKSYSVPFVTTGGTTPYTYTLSGTLPSSISFTSEGLLSGTPRQIDVGNYNIAITVTDANRCSQTTSYTLTINCPTITLTNTIPSSVNVGQAYYVELNATGGNGSYTYSVSSGVLPTGITLSTAGVLSGTPTLSATYNFTITATDANNCTGSQSYSITVSCPTITVDPAVLPAGVIGTTYNKQLASSGGTASYSYSISSGALPAGLLLSTSGLISGTPTSAGSSDFAIMATDANGCMGIQGYSITISCPVITIDPTVLLAGMIGIEYNEQLASSGGTAPYSYSISSGGLPAGLSLSTSLAGLITGTPTHAGSSSFTIMVVDANGCKSTQDYSIVINCPTIIVDQAVLPAGLIGIVYNKQLTSSGGTTPYTYSISSGALPAGLVLNSSGLITGTPTSAGSSDFTIMATDANGCTGIQSYSIGVTCPTITINPTVLPAGIVGTVYNEQLASSGGIAPYSYSISSGVLPAGLSLSSSGSTPGLISGTPTITGKGISDFTITTTDANGCTGTQNYSIAISCPAITVDPMVLSSGVVGTAYNQQLISSGGTAPYSYNISSGTLPSGLSLGSSGSNAGVISGTPTLASKGTSNFTVTITDNSGCTVSQDYALTVACPTITILPTILPSIIIGTSYTQQLNAIGGTPTYTYAITSGNVPSSITLSNAGLITASSTIADVGTYQFTVTVTDSNACTASNNYALTIVPPTITIQPSSLVAGTIGTIYNEQLNASGGSAPYTYGVSSGSLPAGLQLSSVGVLSGTPTLPAGTFDFAITATDKNGAQGTINYNMIISCPTITIDPTQLPNAIIATAYEQQLNAIGGTPTYSYAIVTGALPGSFTLSSNGLLTGQPVAADLGTYNLTVKVTDANQCTALQEYAITVSCPTITIDPTVLANGTLGMPYIAKNLIAIGGTQPYTFAIEGVLPQGLTMNSQTGVISGVPTLAGAFTFEIIATDSNGCPGAQPYTITIACSNITIQPNSGGLTNGFVGIAYPQMQFTAVGGVGAYTFAIGSGTLPTGLTLTTDGKISGIPTVVGNYYFTLIATDVDGCQATQAYNIAISPSILQTMGSTMTTRAIANGIFPESIVGVPYTVQLATSQGAAPYTFVIDSGTLPEGLTITSEGMISGTPISAGLYYFTVLVTDNAGNTIQSIYNITVTCPAITLAPTSLPSGMVGTAYQTTQLSASVDNATFSVISGALPNGLTLSSTGLLSGTPTVAGNYNVTIAAELDNCQGTQSYLIVIVPSNSTINIANAIKDKYC